MTTQYDVIVVGGRLAGASTAMLLAKAGARVLVLERGRPGTDTLSTHALMRAGVLQLSRWGVLDEIVAAGTPPVRHVTFHTGDEPVRVTIKSCAGVDALYAPRRYLLDRVLVEAAARAGAEVRHRARVTGILRDDTGRVRGVRTSHGTLTARYVVAADGFGSQTADAMGAETTARGRGASAMRYAYFEGLEASGYEWAFGDGAAAGLIPTNDGLHGVFVGTTPQRMRTLRMGRSEDAAFEAVFRLGAPGQVEILRAARRVSRHHGWAGAPGYLRQPWGPGWVLVGDAGYFKDPISAHGMTDALRDAELAARAILTALEDESAERVAFADFHGRRDQLSGALLRATDDIATYAWDTHRVQPLVRRMSAAMTDEVEAITALPPAPWAEPVTRACPAGDRAIPNPLTAGPLRA